MFWSIPKQSQGPSATCQGFLLGCCFQPARTSARLRIRQCPLIGTERPPFLAVEGKSIPIQSSHTGSVRATGSPGCPDLEVSCSTQLLKRWLFPALGPREIFYLEDSLPAQRREKLKDTSLGSWPPLTVTLTYSRYGRYQLLVRALLARRRGPGFAGAAIYGAPTITLIR